MAIAQVLLAWCWLLTAVQALTIDANHLQVNGLKEPLGLQASTPRLSWVCLSAGRNEKQNAYQIQASSDSTFIKANLWDTGRVTSGDTSATYSGKALQSRERAYWRVRAWDVHNSAGPWSSVTWFELGLLEQSDWQAQWIENEQYVMGENGLPTFAKQFSTSCAPEKVRLYLLGLGMQWAALNGQPVTDQVLEPGYSTMNTTLYYSSYDISTLIKSGSNVLAVEVGKGVYDAMDGLDGRYTKLDAVGTPLPFKVIAQLEYYCSDGSRKTMLSDNSWKTTVDGPLLESSWYGGYEYDARRQLPESAYLPGGNWSAWQSANLTVSPYPDLHPKLLSANSPPLKIVDTKPVKAITKTNVSWVFDFGQNFAGWYTFTLKGTRGSRIVIWPSERLFANGSADQSTTGTPIFDGYTFASNGTESHGPKFLYHGFRYLEVKGLTSPPDLSSFVGHRIRQDTDTTGAFETNIKLFNDIHSIITQAIQNNLYSVMTDCPTREKLGWLDEEQLAIEPVFFDYDMRGFGRHAMKELRDSQNSQGSVPTTAPQLTEFGVYPPFNYDVAANWGISIVLFAMKHYETYGDIEILTENYANMQAYLEYLIASNSTYIITTDLGDWEAVDQTTPFGVTGTSAFALGAQAMVKIATVLGKPSDASKYAALNERILAAFQETYYNTTHGVTYASGSQCSDAIALNIGVVSPHDKQAVYDHLVQSIRNNGSHLSVGETGLLPFFQMLSEGGYNDVLYDVMSGTTFPSYGYMVANGATALCEHWQGPLDDGSLDHFIFADGDIWLYGLAGMQQSKNSIAWQSIDFAPVIVGDVTSAKTSYQSVRGLAAAEWQKDGSSLTYEVTVPVGSVGNVYMPAALGKVMLDGKAVSHNTEVVSVSSKGNGATIRVGSGTYCFTT